MELNPFARFQNRQTAGRRLAQKLIAYTDKAVVIYALPRGGVAIGAEIAEALHAPLGIVVPRKIGHPIDSEYAIAAVSESGMLVGDKATLVSIDQDWLSVEIDRELHEASRRRALYAKDRPTINVRDKTAIIADDGVATGLTMSAAVLDVRAKSPARIIVAAPVIPEDIKTKLAYQVDEVAALHTPTNGFGAIGQYYDSFDPIEDDEVIALLNQFD